MKQRHHAGAHRCGVAVSLYLIYCYFTCVYIMSLYIRTVLLEVVLEREPGSGSIQFSAYGCIAPTRRLTCVASITRAPVQKDNNLYYPFDKFCVYVHISRTRQTGALAASSGPSSAPGAPARCAHAHIQGKRSGVFLDVMISSRDWNLATGRPSIAAESCACMILLAAYKLPRRYRPRRQHEYGLWNSPGVR